MSYKDLLRAYLKGQWGKVALFAFSLFGGIAVQLLAPQVIRAFIDAAAAGAEVGTLLRLGAWFLALGLSGQAFGVLSTYSSADVGWRATNALRLDLFRHALRLDMSFHKDRTPGEFIERVDGDVTHLSNFFSQFLVQVTGGLLLIGGILVLFWLEDWRVGLVLTVTVVAVTWFMHRRREVAVPASEQEREATAQLFGAIEERLAALDEIRANGASRHVLYRYLLQQRDWYRKSFTAWRRRSTIWSTMMFWSVAGHGLVLALGIYLYQQGTLTLGSVYLFYHYMTLLEGPVERLSQQFQEFQKAGAALRRVRGLLQVRPRIVDGEGVELPVRAHSVAFVDVSFSYSDQDLLRGISFRLEAGESLGLLGRTGSGKTTLVRLLTRLYDPDDGRIELDGVDVRRLKLEALRRRVGLVTQDVQLFRGTLRENLTFFDPSIPDERIFEALELLGLVEWVKKLPAGLDTPLQAGGSGLSAGEAQLLTLARFFLQNPGVVVLDEPSSRLDPATEKLLTRAMDRLFEGRTAIVIAHRLETIQRVDKVMILSDGRIAEFGEREALAADPRSRYRAMLAAAARAGDRLQLDGGPADSGHREEVIL